MALRMSSRVIEFKVVGTEKIEREKKKKENKENKENKEERKMELNGIEFIEFGKVKADCFQSLDFSCAAVSRDESKHLYQLGRVKFLLSRAGFAKDFSEVHGPSAVSTGFKVSDANVAFDLAVKNGARAFKHPHRLPFPAVYGIGESAVYFVDPANWNLFLESEFGSGAKPNLEAHLENRPLPVGVIDHMTNNVPKGEMQKWCDFYEKIFGFKEKRYFDIKGAKTGLVSKVMRSQDGTITIPINEPTDGKSQIQEYLDEYKGSGIQHIALLTTDIVSVVRSWRKNGISFLDVPDTYYEAVPARVPQLKEDLGELKELKILVDGDESGYLLQIFTQNQIGPIFFEVIQRKGHDGFGEGNFQALFEAIERDQQRRGVL